MKKLLFVLVMMLPIFAFANNNTSAVELKNESTMASSENYTYYHHATVTISSNDVTLPLSITVPAPHNGYEVIGIYGPVQPNCGTWSVSNDNLTITYTRAPEIFELEIPNVYEINVSTYNKMTQEYRIYIITLIVQ